MFDRSKPAPGYDVWNVDDDEFYATHEEHGALGGAFPTRGDAVAATWVAYDAEHAEAIKDFAERAALGILKLAHNNSA